MSDYLATGCLVAFHAHQRFHLLVVRLECAIIGLVTLTTMVFNLARLHWSLTVALSVDRVGCVVFVQLYEMLYSTKCIRGRIGPQSCSHGIQWAQMIDWQCLICLFGIS